MNIKEVINGKTEQLDEMAAKELKKVEKSILAGDIDKAAREYVDLGGSPRSNAVSKTINSFISKNPDKDPAPFNKFREVVAKIGMKEQPIEKKVYKKVKATGITKEGEKVEAGRTARAQKKIETDQLTKLTKHIFTGEKEKNILLDKSVEEKKNLAAKIHDDQRTAGDIRSLRAWLNRGDKKAVEIVDGKSRTVVNRKHIIGIIKNSLEDVKEKEFKLIASRPDRDLSVMVAKLIKMWEKDLATLKSFSQTGANQKAAEKIMTKSVGKGIENIKLLGTVASEKKGMKESTNLYEEMLMGVYEYEGDMFWENYTLSNLVRNFPEYIINYGEEEAVEMFTAVYGEETKPLFEYMVENQMALYETALYVGSGLLFETVGERNIDKYLTEADFLQLTPGSGRVNFSRALGKQKAGLAGMLKSAGAAASTGIRKTNIMGFLKGLWGKLKELGKDALNKIVPFLKSGFAWAKQIATKGIAWIANNPIARVAVPAVLIAGGAVGAIAMINKIRKKMNKKKMTSSEEEDVKNIAEKNKGKIERARRKAGLKAAA